MSLLWNQMECSKNEFHRQRGQGHRHVEDSKQENTDLQTIVSAIEVQNGQHNEIREKESHNSTKADAAIPKNCGKRDISYGAHKGKNSDDRSDSRTPKLRQNGMSLQEECLPEALRDPGGQCSGNQQ